MLEEKTKTSYSGIGFISLLQLVFITLKLIGVITCSWFWVLSPFIFSIGLFVLLILIIFIVFIVKQVDLKIDSKKINER